MAALTAGPTSTASSAKTARMRALAIGRRLRRPPGGKNFLFHGPRPMENRHGLAVAGMVAPTALPSAALRRSC